MSRKIQPPTMHTKLVAASISDMVQEWYNGRCEVPNMTACIFEQRISRFQSDLTPPAADYVAGLEAAAEALWSAVSTSLPAGKRSKLAQPLRDLNNALAARPASPDKPALDAAEARIAALTDALTELHAMVVGECPSLLNEDSGGNGELSCQINGLLAGEMTMNTTREADCTVRAASLVRQYDEMRADSKYRSATTALKTIGLLILRDLAALDAAEARA